MDHSLSLLVLSDEPMRRKSCWSEGDVNYGREADADLDMEPNVACHGCQLLLDRDSSQRAAAAVVSFGVTEV